MLLEFLSNFSRQIEALGRGRHFRHVAGHSSQLDRRAGQGFLPWVHRGRLPGFKSHVTLPWELVRELVRSRCGAGGGAGAELVQELVGAGAGAGAGAGGSRGGSRCGSRCGCWSGSKSYIIVTPGTGRHEGLGLPCKILVAIGPWMEVEGTLGHISQFTNWQDQGEAPEKGAKGVAAAHVL